MYDGATAILSTLACISIEVTKMLVFKAIPHEFYHYKANGFLSLFIKIFPLIICKCKGKIFMFPLRQYCRVYKTPVTVINNSKGEDGVKKTSQYSIVSAVDIFR